MGSYITGTPEPDTLTGIAEKDTIRAYGGMTRYLVLKAMIKIEMMVDMISYMVIKAETESELIMQRI
jgi:hypothetical protein